MPHFPLCQPSQKPYYVRPKVCLSTVLFLTMANDKWLGKAAEMGQEFINAAVNSNLHNFVTLRVKYLIQRVYIYICFFLSRYCHFLDLCNNPEWKHRLIFIFFKRLQRSLVWPPVPSWVSCEIFSQIFISLCLHSFLGWRLQTVSGEPFFFTHLGNYK